MTKDDIARFRRAVHLRDRCVRAAVEWAERLGLPMTGTQARMAYDAMTPIIAEANAGRSVREQIERSPVYTEAQRQVLLAALDEVEAANGLRT
jgi:hypothetical protein